MMRRCPLFANGVWRLPVVVAALLAVGSCGGEDEQSGSNAITTVLPFEEVQASELVFEGDPTDPGRGILRVTTTEPMICAIVWGEDDSFGRFNNSLSMNGTGIEQHDVVLPDVEAGVEYRYVVQGTTADGTLYRSDVGLFRIDAAAPAATVVDRGENLALDASVVEVSSEFSAEFAGSLAVDGDTSTEWSTSGDGDDGFITIDLGADREIGGVEFVTRSMADGTARTEMFTVSVDDGDTLGPFRAGTVAEPRLAEIDTAGRRVRLDIDVSTGGNVGAVEIRVFGTES
ncbi:MAG: discoidin domain-containing protein [Acidimicrobiia bacterium]|nr:discoidin domain-containing protein [Acidimicrobiia bacterium]